MKIRKTYSFAFWSALLITFFTSITIALSAYFILDLQLKPAFILLYMVIVFIFTFLVVQYRLEKFIYQRIKKIYDSVAILDSSDFNKTSITSDLNTLSEEVQKFAELKQTQIQNLTLRESYRREFLGNVSHELKTPIFMVQGYLLTLTGGAINDKKITKQYLKRANKGVERLIAIVKDLDLIAKLESADLNLNKQPFDVVDMIKSVFELLEMKAKKRKISLLFDKVHPTPIMVIGDVERIEQVFINLIVNSIKYGKTKGSTIVSISSSNHKITINVTDDGEGISLENQARIFERFYRVDKSRSRDQGGSGLGLSIVKHIIEAHNEHIYVKSTLGKGSIFSFTLEKAENI
jgi:two-component system phosphate regulon sensor histidine kinase PhoR